MCSPFGFLIQNIFICLFIVKKWPLFVNFSISLVEFFFSSQCSAPLVGMRFCRYVPNSPRNKNFKLHDPYLFN
jgi:hypothetical protein